MHKRIVGIISVLSLMVSCLPGIAKADENAVTLCVSVDGSDNNTGTEQAPLATLEGARQKVREVLSKNPEGISVDVIFKKGTYRIYDTVQFDKFDSAMPDYRVTYRGEDGVCFTSSRPIDITKITLVTSRNILKRLPTAAKGKVGQLDLKAQGFNEFSEFNPLGSSTATEDYSFYLNGVEQPPAQWPNGDGNYATMSKIIAAGSSGNTNTNGGKFGYTESNPERWTTAKDFYIEGYFGHDYRHERVLAKGIDLENQAIELKYGTDFGIRTTESKRWKAVNLLEELDSPGEWYLDRQNGMLYYYPETGLKDAEFEIAYDTNSIINMTGTSNVTFKNINFSKIRGSAVGASNYPTNDTFEDCNFTNINGIAIVVSGNLQGTVDRGYNEWQNIRNGAREWKISRCSFVNIGQYGIRLNSGDRETLEPGNSVIENCYFYKIASKKQACMGIWLQYGCGDIVRHNIMHCNSFHCIDYNGNNYRIENNELYNSIREVSDCGIVYTGRSFSQRGTRISYNYIHDGVPIDARIPASNNGIYWDDAISGQIADHNIFQNVYRAVCANGISDSQILSNIFVDCPFATHANNNFLSSDDAKNRATLQFKAVENNEAYQTAYPNMATLAGKYLGLAGCCKIKDNVSYNSNYTIYDEVKKYGDVENNIEVKDTKTFVDYDNKDFRVKGDSDTVLGENYDISEIGFTKDEETGKIYQPEVFQSDFQQIYPANGASNISFKNIHFMWQDSVGADKYRIVVAKDKELKDVVIDEYTNFNYYDADELDPEIEKYYWKVYAINTSRQLASTWESNNVTFIFNLSSEYELDKTLLEKNIEMAKSFLEKVEEGEKPAQFKEGARVTLESLIEDGQKYMGLESDTVAQKQVNECANALAEFMDNDDWVNGGIIDIKSALGDAERWSKPEIVTEDEGEKSVFIDGSEGALSVGYKGYYYASRNSLYSFKMKMDYTGEKPNWIGIGIRGEAGKNIAGTGNNNYFFVIKQNSIEFQRNLNGPAIVKEFENKALEFGKWHDVCFGAIDMGSAQLIVLYVDGKSVLEYLDTSASQFLQRGDLLYHVCAAHTLQLKPSDNIPDNDFFKEIVKKNYEELQKGYFETIKTVIDNPIMMNVNCKNYAVDEGIKEFSGGIPQIYNNKTLVPLRTISEFFGAEVSWDEENRQAIIKSGGREIVFTEGKNEYSVGDEVKTLVQAPIIRDNSLLVPIRDAAENLGKDVYWFDTGLIVIGTNQRIDTQNKYNLLISITDVFQRMNDLK